MRVQKRVNVALIALLFSVLLPITSAFASDDRVVDIAEITWNGASKPTASSQDVKNSIVNSVSDSWKTFTTNENDAKARTINFIYGKTLETPIRLSAPMTCEGSRFLSLMREIQSETYRRLGIENWKERYLVILAPSAGCLWMGRAEVGTPGTKGGVIMLHNTARAFVITHELGHSLGLGHSNFINCGNSQADGVWARECKAVEYGGTIDVMGNVETTSTLSTYHQWRMGLLDTDEIAQSWLNEDITLSATDVIGGKRAIFIRNNNSTYWIEYRRAKPGVSYKPGLVIYRTDPPPSSAIESPIPEDQLDQGASPGIGTDIWMMNFDDYQYSMTGRATGSMSLTLGKLGSIAGANITVTAAQGANEKTVRITIKRSPDTTPPPAPEIIDPSSWLYPDISIIKPGYDDGESAIAGFEVNLNGKIASIEPSSTENFTPTYLNPFTSQKTIYLKNLPEGDYTLAVRATDVWGNKSPWSKSVKVYVDRGNPVVSSDLKIATVNKERTVLNWTGVKDAGIGLCSTILHNDEGFVLSRSTAKSSPTFSFTTGRDFDSKVQVFDCLGNGMTGSISVKTGFLSASDSTRTGKWSPAPASYGAGALKCTGKCSASISVKGNIIPLLGDGGADILVSGKSVAKVANSSSGQIRYTDGIAIGARKKVVRIQGSNFIFAGIAQLDFTLGKFEPLAKSVEFPDPSLVEPIQKSMSELGFSASDFTQEWTVLPMARGTTLQDPTLDLCGATYSSESGREIRRQVSVTRVDSPYTFLSTEAVKYKSAAAASDALAELKKNYEACVTNKGGNENGVFTDYSFQALPFSNASFVEEKSRVMVRATIGKGLSARQLLGIYQYSGSYFTGLYVITQGDKPIADAEVLRWLDVAGIMATRLQAASNS